jgi:hypothetical protein
MVGTGSDLASGGTFLSPLRGSEYLLQCIPLILSPHGKPKVKFYPFFRKNITARASSFTKDSFPIVSLAALYFAKPSFTCFVSTRYTFLPCLHATFYRLPVLAV